MPIRGGNKRRDRKTDRKRKEKKVSYLCNSTLRYAVLRLVPVFVLVVLISLGIIDPDHFLNNDSFPFSQLAGCESGHVGVRVGLFFVKPAHGGPVLFQIATVNFFASFGFSKPFILFSCRTGQDRSD